MNWWQIITYVVPFGLASAALCLAADARRMARQSRKFAEQAEANRQRAEEALRKVQAERARIQAMHGNKLPPQSVIRRLTGQDEDPQERGH